MAIREGPSRRTLRGDAPPEEELLAPLAELALEMREQSLRPGQGPSDPAPNLAPIQQVEAAGERGHGEALVHEGLDDTQDLAEAGGLVGQVAARGETWEAARRNEFLDGDRMLPVTSLPHPSTIPAGRPNHEQDSRANEGDPCGMVTQG